MFISADQLLAHAIGDYVFQSDWMATTKTKKSIAALAHVLTYVIPFAVLFRKASWPALAFIVGTHFVIDRWRLARFVVTGKNYLGGPEYRKMSVTSYWCSINQRTGYPEGTPDWLAFWLLIIADNIMHVICNGLALKLL